MTRFAPESCTPRETILGRVLSRDGFTACFVPVDDEPAGKILGRFEGIAGAGGRILEPHLLVAIRPLLTEALEVSGKILGAKKQGEPAEQLRATVSEALKKCAERLTPPQRHGAEATAPLAILLALLEACPTSEGVELACRIRDHRRVHAGQLASLERTRHWCSELSGLETKAREKSLDAALTAIASCKDALGRGDAARIARTTGELLALVSQDESAISERGASLCMEILAVTGAIVVTASNLASFDNHEARFLKTTADTVFEGRKAGAVLEVLSPGVAFEGDLVVPPRVLVNRGEPTPFDRVVQRIEDAAPRAGARGSVTAAVARARSRADRSRKETGDEAAFVPALLDLVAETDRDVDADTRAVVRTLLETGFGIEVLKAETGARLDLSASETTGLLQEVEWVASSLPAGTVVETLRPGFRSGSMLLPARLAVSRGTEDVFPLLRKVMALRVEGEGALATCLARMRSFHRTEADPPLTRRELALCSTEAMRLHDLLGPEGLGGLRRNDVEDFLRCAGYEPFPGEGSVLCAEDLENADHGYELEYRRDDAAGPGAIVQVLRTGWLASGVVARRAKAVVSLGAPSDLERLTKKAIAAAAGHELGAGTVARLKELLSDKLQARLGSPEVLLQGSATRKRELARAGLSVLQEVEALISSTPDEDEVHRSMRSLLESELRPCLQELGIVLTPAAGVEIGAHAPELDVRSVFDDETEEGRVVRVVHHAVLRADNEGEVRNLIRRGEVEVSRGPTPELLRHLQALGVRVGDPPLPALASLTARVHTEIEPRELRSGHALASLAGELARLVDALWAHVAEGSEDGERGDALSRAILDLVRHLEGEGLEVFPGAPAGTIRHPRFSQIVEEGWLATGEATADIPKGDLIEVERRAAVFRGEVKARARLRVSGGAPDPVLEILSGIAESEPQLSRRAVDTSQRLRELDERQLVMELEGKAKGSSLDAERAKLLLDLVDALGEIGGPGAKEDSELAGAGRAILGILADRFGVRVIPDGRDDLSTLESEKKEGDTIEARFGDEEAGALVVMSYGYRQGERRRPFRVQVVLGREPDYWTALARHPRFGSWLDASGTESEEEGRIAAILDEFRVPGADPGDVEGFALARLVRIHDIIHREMKDALLGREFLSFLATRLELEVHPAAGKTFHDYEDWGIPEANLEVEYDYYADDWAIDPAKVTCQGVRMGGRVFAYPSFTVNRKEKSPPAALLVDRLLPVVRTRLATGKPEEAEGLARLRDRVVRFQLRSREIQESAEGAKEVLAFIGDLGRIVPKGTKVPTPEGHADVGSVVEDLVRRGQRLSR
jgi:hypothetical protein